MASTLKDISGYLTKHDIKHDVQEEKQRIVTGTRTEHYQNPEGRKGLLIGIELEEHGEFLKVVAPNCYHYPDGPHRAALFQTCLMVSHMTKMVQFEYDPDTGEVRAIIEFPLEDAPLTEKQFMRCIYGLVQLVEEYDDEIRDAMQKGLVMESMQERRKAFEEWLRLRRRTSRDIQDTDLDLEE